MQPPVLDWAHEVYPAAGHTIEELGYKEFNSLEDAYEHFGIKQDELLTTAQTND